jgi:hypothetical protein
MMNFRCLYRKERGLPPLLFGYEPQRTVRGLHSDKAKGYASESEGIAVLQRTGLDEYIAVDKCPAAGTGICQNPTAFSAGDDGMEAGNRRIPQHNIAARVPPDSIFPMR